MPVGPFIPDPIRRRNARELLVDHGEHQVPGCEDVEGGVPKVKVPITVVAGFPIAERLSFFAHGFGQTKQGFAVDTERVTQLQDATA